MTPFDTLFSGRRIMIIMRGLAPDAAAGTAQRAWDAGVDLVEVPIGQPGQEKALAAVAAAGRDQGIPVGAGTVITRDHVRRAVDAGAAYTVAPGLDVDVADASRDAGLPHMPGVATPTEVQHAAAANLDWVKVFPASLVGGPSWIRAIRGPFPQVSFLATGGIQPHQVGSYLDAGVSVVGMGRTILDGPPERLEQMISEVR